MPEKLNLRAYYYEFESTGNLAVDKILEAVACAGKAYHSTEFWYGDDGADETDYIALIQDAANKAAAMPAPSKAKVAREFADEVKAVLGDVCHEMWRSGIQPPDLKSDANNSSLILYRSAIGHILKKWEDAERDKALAALSADRQQMEGNEVNDAESK